MLVTSLVQISVCAEDSSSVALGPASGAGGARGDGDGDTPFLLRPSVVLFSLKIFEFIFFSTIQLLFTFSTSDVYLNS